MSNELVTKLINVQSRLKAPKNQHNSFGKYKYRSCEDILEAVKPLLTSEGLFLNLSDEIINVGNSNYVKATATVKDATGKVLSTSSACARESVTKKGMDDSQITGTASSYARKYALNGLFLIDDTKDADTNEYKNNSEKNKPSSRDWEKEINLAMSEADIRDIYLSMPTQILRDEFSATCASRKAILIEMEGK